MFLMSLYDQLDVYVDWDNNVRVQFEMESFSQCKLITSIEREQKQKLV